MTKRLLWNFEIQGISRLDFSALANEEKESVRWEARYFWPDQSPIALSGLDEHFLDLSGYSYKKHNDQYFLLPEFDLNIKNRNDQFIYKPLVQKVNGYCGFEKKIIISENSSDFTLKTHLELTPHELLQMLKQHNPIAVTKIAATWTVATKPKTKLEFSRLRIHNQTYFSLCIEGRALAHVQSISRSLLKTNDAPLNHYVNFLRTIVSESNE